MAWAPFPPASFTSQTLSTQEVTEGFKQVSGGHPAAVGSKPMSEPLFSRHFSPVDKDLSFPCIPSALTVSIAQLGSISRLEFPKRKWGTSRKVKSYFLHLPLIDQWHKHHWVWKSMIKINHQQGVWNSGEDNKLYIKCFTVANNYIFLRKIKNWFKKHIQVLDRLQLLAHSSVLMGCFHECTLLIEMKRGSQVGFSPASSPCL